MMFIASFKKSVALVLVVIFIMTQNAPLSWSQVMQALEGTVDAVTLPQQIPSEFGSIQSSYEGINGKSVVLIQDAHASLPVQKNIRSLISFLNQEYGINLLMLEGAAQKLEPDLYRFYEEAEPSRLVGERLLERGELTGAEIFLLDQAIDQNCEKNCAEGQGAESAMDYADNLTTFREMISRDTELAAAMDRLSVLFQKKAGSVLKPELLQFLKAVDQAETAAQALPETLYKINLQAQASLQMDLLNPKHQFEYPMLVRYFKLKEMEGKINPELAEIESQRLVKWLESNKAPQSLVKQIRELSPKLSQMRAVLEELVLEMQPKGFEFKNYPEWTRWAGMNALMQEVEPSALMKEMEQLTWEIVSKLAPQPEEQAILSVYRKIFYLRKLLLLGLTSDEWQKVKQRNSEIKPSNLWKELQGADFDANFDKAFLKALDFYKVAEEREIGFIENLQKQMQAKKQNHAILVAGGFHQAGVLEKLKSAGYGYVSIMPNAGGFDLKESKKTYRRAMLESSQVQQFLRMVNLSQTAPEVASLASPENRRSEISAAMAGVRGTARSGTARDQLQSGLVRSEARAPYAVPKDFKEGVERFYAYKLEMLNALNQEDAEEFRGALGDFYQIVDDLNKPKLKTIGQSKLDDAYAATNGLPADLVGHESAQSVLREIETLGVGKGDADYQALRLTIIQEFTEELYPDSQPDQERLSDQLSKDILTTDIRNLMSANDFEGPIESWKQKALHQLEGLSQIINSWGHYSLLFKNIKVNPNPKSMTVKGAESEKDRELILRSTIKHEAIHYLSDDISGRGRILKVPAEWEFLTYAIDVVERVEHMPEGAKLDDYKDEFGDQALEALFEQGRQFARDGGAGLEIKEGVAGGAGSGVFFDGLYAQAVLAYKAAGLSTTAFLNRYAGQRAVAIVLGGFLYEKQITDSQFGTLAYLKSVFDALDSRQGAPLPEEKPHMEKVFAELQSYVSSLAGEHVEMRPVSGGFWHFQNGIDGGTGELQYLPSDFRPRFEDGELKDRVAAMRERVLGHALLALGRTNHARAPSERIIADKILNHPAFGIAWDIFSLPHVIQMTLTQLGFKQGLSDTFKKGAVLWIHRVFQDRYSPQIPISFSKAKLASMPLHLQYLDSLTYMFVNVKKESRNGQEVFVAEDPRLENRAVLEEIQKSFGDFQTATESGWGAGKILLDSGKLDLEKFTNIFGARVWPAYERLYNLALEQEMQKLEASNKVKEDAKDEMNKQHQQMAENSLQQSQNQFQGQMQSGQTAQDSAGQGNAPGQSGQPGQSGGEAGQPGGQGGVEGMMQALQGSSQPSTESGSGSGQPGQTDPEQPQAGDKNPFKPFQNPSAPSPQQSENPLSMGGDAATQQAGADSKGMQQMLTGLEQQLNSLSSQVQGLQSQLGQMGQNLSEMQNQASGLGSQAGDSAAQQPQSGLSEALQSGASSLDQGTQSLQQDAGSVLQGAQSAKEQAKQAAAQQPWSPDALQAQNQSEQATQDAQQLKNQAAKLKEMAAKIKQQIAQITKDLEAEGSPDVSTLSAQAAAVQKNIQEFKNQAAKMQGSAQNMDSTLEGLQSSVQGLQQAMKNLEGKQGEGALQPGQGKSSDQPGQEPKGASSAGQPAGQSSEPSSPAESSEGGNGARFDLPLQASGLTGLTGIGSVEDAASKPTKSKLQPFKPSGVTIDMDEEADAKKWGFTVKEWQEYLSWKKEKVTVARGRKVEVKRLIDETKEFLDALLLPVRKTNEVGPFTEGEALGDDHLVEAAMGQPAMVDEVKKLPVLMSISIIFDRSGSMGWGTPGSEPIKLAKLIGFVLLEALFEHNEERETRGYRDQPLRFELGLFENDPTLLVSHETTQNTDPLKRSSKKIVYDLIKKLEAGGGTSFSDALGAFIEKTKKDDEPNYTSPKAIRMLFAVTDEQVSDDQKSEVMGFIEDAKQNRVPVFIVPVGSAAERSAAISVHGEENVILAKPLSLLPQAIAAKMVTAVSEIYPAMPISEDVLHFARSEVRGPLEKIETGTFDENGDKRYWKHFYTQKRDGRDYLVWHDAENPDQMLAWERGPGGPQVPRMKIPPTTSNELFIKEILKSLYRADSHFSSVSSDGKWLLRETGSGEMELDQFDVNVGRTTELLRSNSETLARTQFKDNVYSNGTVWWKREVNQEGLKLSLDGKHFEDFAGADISFEEMSQLDFQRISDQKIAVFDHRSGRVYLADKAKADWKVTDTLQLESEELSDRWYRRLIEVTGETGLAKDVLMMAAAEIMNEQMFFIPINENLKEGELDWRRVLGLEGEGTTSDLPSALALAQEHGGWVLLREAHKMPEELWPLLKVKISDRSHKSLAGDKPVIRPDHPRFRMLASSNLARRNIQGAANRDQAVQRRKEAILKTWEWPQDEVMLQLEFARTLAIELGVYNQGFDQEMGPVIQRLVNTAVAQRLTFLGYSNKQQQELLKNRRSWEQLKDWDYAPDNKAGEMLKRAPSPRVIRNIVAHFVKYPKDLEHRPWSVIHGYFNFDAEIDRDGTYSRVETDFEKVGFQDDQKNETPVLKPESFKVLKNGDGSFSLEITPIENGQPRWEKVVVPLHKDSDLAKDPNALPKKLMGWLELPENALTVYQMMQDYSLGKDTMLVGEQETGKSVLIEESEALVGKKPIQKVGITQHTKPKDITYQMDMKVGKTRFTKKPVAIAAEEGLPVHLEEANQAESLAVLNDLLDSRMLIDPLGNRVQIARGFVAWLSINPPGQGFLVNTFSDEFLERVAIRKVHPLPSAQVRAYLEQAIYKNGKSVNSRFVGEEKRGGAAGEWTGLIGLAQKIRELRTADPQFLPRAPGPGTLESMVSDILDHYETNLADRNIYLKEELASEKVNVPKVSASEIIRLYFAGAYDKDAKLKNAIAKHMVRPQEVVRDMLLRKFTMQGKGSSQNAQWVTHFTEAMEKVGLWVDTDKKPGEDGILKFLAGEELVAESYPILREPKTGDAETDTLLKYLQMYPKSLAFIGKADELVQKIDLLSMINDATFNMLEWSDLLERFAKLAEIHGVLAAVHQARQKEMAAGNTQMAANGIKLKELSQMILKLTAGRNWPTYVLNQAEDPSFDASAELKNWLSTYAAKKEGLGKVADPQVRDIFTRGHVFTLSAATDSAQVKDGKEKYKADLAAEKKAHDAQFKRSEARLPAVALAGVTAVAAELFANSIAKRSEARGAETAISKIEKQITDQEKIIAELQATIDEGAVLGEEFVAEDKTVLAQAEQQLAKFKEELAQAIQSRKYTDAETRLVEVYELLTAKEKELKKEIQKKSSQVTRLQAEIEALKKLLVHYDELIDVEAQIQKK